MMVISAKGLGKKYSLGEAHTNLLSERMGNGLRSFYGRLRGRGPAGRPRKSSGDEFWALRDLDFEVKRGEVLGIIGRNGAGKSTLLKILSRITWPTEGNVELYGRVASLLEVGTGFHPELTGRENIFLNGAILGMSRAEIRKKFDEITAFAEVEKFVDTPVKHYSSGMYVRLAFAVAAHLEPEILIIDEVLAVGDAQFQKKCLGKMGDVAREGRTVLFVSHNMSFVRNLCSLALLLENGRIKFQGAVPEALAEYERGTARAGDVIETAHFQGPLSDQVLIDKIVFLQGGAEAPVLDPLLQFEIRLHGRALRTFQTLELSIQLFRDGLHIASCFDSPDESMMREGRFISSFRMPAEVLRPGRYTIAVGAASSVGNWIWGGDVANLDFIENWGGKSAERTRGIVALPYTAERIQPG